MHRSSYLMGLLLLAVGAGCAGDFEPVSKIASVRILAARADRPYAKPDEVVALEVLAVDGRPDQARPMTVYWLPAPCLDPPGEAYYGCYPAFEAIFTRGVDLTPVLVSGAKLSFQIPADILMTSPSSQSGIPYANVFAFSMACAGHVQYVGQRGPSPQAVPFACFDADGTELDTSDFVFAHSRIFVFADRTNANPVIEALTVNGQPVDPTVGLVVDRCATPSDHFDNATCPASALDVVVPPTSQELDPSNIDPEGKPLSEGLWVDYYVTGGQVRDDVRVLYDVQVGRVASATDFEAPAAAGDFTMWAVAHDNRGGVSWTEIPVHAK